MFSNLLGLENVATINAPEVAEACMAGGRARRGTEAKTAARAKYIDKQKGKRRDTTCTLPVNADESGAGATHQAVNGRLSQPSTLTSAALAAVLSFAFCCFLCLPFFCLLLFSLPCVTS